MARSSYWPHPIYLETYIVFTFLITGCNASENSRDMIGIIAGSIFACILFLAGVVGIVYCVIKAQRSREARKQQIINASNNLDYRTLVVRRIPTTPGHPSAAGYSEFVVGYQPPVHGGMHPRIPMRSHMATISHMPVHKSTLVSTAYSTSRPRKPHRSSRDKSIEDRKWKRESDSDSRQFIDGDEGSESNDSSGAVDEISRGKSRTRSKPSVQNSISNQIVSDFKGNSLSDVSRGSQFILKKKEDVYSKSNPLASPESKPNEPYALTSLFSRAPEPSQRAESWFYPTPKEETPKAETKTDDADSLQFTDILQPNVYSTREQPRTSSRSFPKRVNLPERLDSEVSDDTELKRPLTPDYDVDSMTGEENADISFTRGNKFAYAVAKELQQNFRFLSSSYTSDGPTVDPFGSTSKQVQFNPLSFQESNSSIKTSDLNPGTYSNIPPAPPLPSS